jgi:hypothetical protein
MPRPPAMPAKRSMPGRMLVGGAAPWIIVTIKAKAA